MPAVFGRDEQVAAVVDPLGATGARLTPAPAPSQRISRPRSASRSANSSSTRSGGASTQSPSLSLTAASAAAAVAPCPTEVAGQRRSGGNSSCSIARLRPIPITAQSGGRASSRTPAALRSLDPDVVRPLHPALQTAPATPPPRRPPAAPRAAGGRARAPAGEAIAEYSSALPAGAAQARPRRPRPAVCSSAVTTVPPGAPASASSRARSLVESVTRKWRRGRPKAVIAAVTARRRTTSSPGPRPQPLGGAAAVDGQRQAPVGVHVEDQLAGADVGEGEREDGAVTLTAGLHRDAVAHPQPGLRQVPVGEVEHRIAEAVDGDHVGDDAALADLPARSPRAWSATPPRPARRRPRSDAPSARWAATGANTSRPWNVAEIGSSRNGDSDTSTASTAPAEALDRRPEQAVVGPDEHPVLRGDPDRDRAPRSSPPRDRPPPGGRRAARRAARWRGSPPPGGPRGGEPRESGRSPWPPARSARSPPGRRPRTRRRSRSRRGR